MNDRVICCMGEHYMPGRVFSVDVDQEGDIIPYGVKLDMGRLIVVPHDEDGTCMREVCFDSWQLASDAAPTMLPKDIGKPTRFSQGERVAFRIHDRTDGFDQWLCGKVVATWCELKDGKKIPYELCSDDDDDLTKYFCHNDDHTLIRTVDNIPAERCKTIAPRMEKRKLEDGQIECIDHVTGNKRIRKA